MLANFHAVFPLPLTDQKKIKLTPKLANTKIQFSENSIIFTNYGLVFNGIRQNRWDNLRQDLMKIYSI